MADGEAPEQSAWPLVAAATALGVATVTASLYSFLRHGKRSSDMDWPTVPGAWPLFGHFPYIQSLDRMCDVLSQWADQYGTSTGCFEITMPGGRQTLVVCREDAAVQIMNQRPQKVYRTTELREAIRSIHANGVFAAEGPQWQRERKLASAALNRKQLTQHYLPMLKEQAHKLIDKWIVSVEQQQQQQQQQQNQSNSGDGGILQGTRTDLGGMTADGVCNTVLGQDFDFLHHPNSTVAKDVRAVVKAATLRALMPIWYWRIPVVGQYLDGYGWSVERLRRIIQDTIQSFQSEKRQDDDQGDDPDDNDNTYLKKIMSLAQSESNKKPLTMDRVVGNAATVFIAGTDTTEKTLVQALYQLALRPELQTTLRKSVQDFDWDAASMDDFYAKIPRVKSFLQEVHRYFLFPLMFLETNEEIPFRSATLPAGLQIFVHIRHCATQRDRPSKGVPFGPNQSHPQVFDPERYLVYKDYKHDESTLTCADPVTTSDSAAFMMFGSGVKSCPGRKYSELLSYCTLVAMLQTFEDIALVPNSRDQEQVKLIWDTVCLSPDRPLHFKFTKARK